MASYEKGEAMEDCSYFYQAVTKIAEDRMLELLQHAKDADVRDGGFPDAGAYFRACAQTVYLAWRDITDGWHRRNDVERLAALIDLPLWAHTSSSTLDA